MVRKDAGRELTSGEMVFDTVATDAVSGAATVAAVAAFFVFSLFTFHEDQPSCSGISILSL